MGRIPVENVQDLPASNLDSSLRLTPVAKLRGMPIPSHHRSCSRCSAHKGLAMTELVVEGRMRRVALKPKMDHINACGPAHRISASTNPIAPALPYNGNAGALLLWARVLKLTSTRGGV
jgi:hypothetical protein